MTRCVIEFCCTGRRLDAAGATSKRQRRGQEPHRAVLRAEVFDTVGKPLPTSLDRGGAERDLMELNGWTSPQMLSRYGASARGARARRSYDRIMDDTT